MKTESRESFSLQESMHCYIPQYIPNQPQQAIRKVEWEYSQFASHCEVGPWRIREMHGRKIRSRHCRGERRDNEVLR